MRNSRVKKDKMKKIPAFRRLKGYVVTVSNPCYRPGGMGVLPCICAAGWGPIFSPSRSVIRSNFDLPLTKGVKICNLE